MPFILIFLLLLFIACVVLVLTGIRIVPQAQEFVVERIGAYHSTWKTGVHYLFPFIDRIRNRVDLREKMIDIRPQPVITKDNVTVLIDALLFYQFTDSKLLTYGMDNFNSAIANLTVTTLRNYTGDKELEQLLVSRDEINRVVTAALDQATDRWGIKIIRVEIQNITPPQSILESLEKQMRAERERRQMVLLAEGEKQSAILAAQGAKESEILKAEAENRATILKADAIREQKIREAQGEAESIRLVQQATAEGVKLLKEADPTDELVIALKGFDALIKMGESPSAKVIIPSNLQGVAGLAASIKELAK